MTIAMFVIIVALAVSILLAPTIPTGSGALGSAGKVKEVVKAAKIGSREFYVVDVKESPLTEKSKRVDIELICKNNDPSAKVCFHSTQFSLVDNEGRSYKSAESSIPLITIPAGDIVRGVLGFDIPRNSSPDQLAFKNVFGLGFGIDLTSVKTPNDPLPSSDWALSTNSGVIFSDDSLELRILNEHRSGNYYQLDASVTNLSSDSLTYSMFDMYAKDQDGFAYGLYLLSDADPKLDFGELEPGKTARGWIEFPTRSDSQNFMLVYDSNDGPYFVSGSYSGTNERVSAADGDINEEDQLPKSPIGISIPVVITGRGKIVESGNVGIPLGVRVELSNESRDKVSMSYIVQVKDWMGMTVYMRWISDLTLKERETSSPVIFWTPDAEGDYTIDTFVWSSTSNPRPLAPQVKLTVKV